MSSTDSENLLANCVIPSMETPTPSLELDDVLDGLHDASACVCTEFYANGLADHYVARTNAA